MHHFVTGISICIIQLTSSYLSYIKTEDALRIPGINFSPQYHADSKEKPEDRIIGDLSGQHDAAFTPLNGSRYTTTAGRKQTSDSRYVSQNGLGICRFAWLGHLISSIMTQSFVNCFVIVFIHLAGLFSWIDMPHAFQVLTRALQAMCRHNITGLSLMAISHKNLYTNDSEFVDINVQR